VLANFAMEHRNGRARSAMESLRRRQLEARRLSESSPIAGLGTYQMMRPARGREVIGPRAPLARPSRVPNGSDAFGLIETDLPLASPPPRVAPPPPEDRTMVVARRIYRAEIAPPPRESKRRRNSWLLPIGLSAALSTLIIALALYLR